MHAQNKLTVPHTAYRVGLHMVRSSYSVVAINIKGFYCGRSLHHGNVNNRELLLAIYVKGKNISRRSCIHENILS